MEFLMTSITFLVLGMFLGNLILIVLGLTPLIFLAFGLLLSRPEISKVERNGQDQKVWVDQEVGDSVRGEITGGAGLVMLSDVLPKSFKLEKGTNFKALWKGLSDVETEFDYIAKCAKRGQFQLEGISFEIRHPLGISQNLVGVFETPRTFVAEPKPLLVKRVREHKSMSRIPMPMEARFKFGVPTTEFVEIRDYAPGDSYRKINWKASAKKLSTKPGQYLVNEYEKEGKKVVWIFLDSASRMSMGTTVKNILEYALRSALGFSHFYLGRECRVGFAVYDHDAYQWEGSFQPHERDEAPPLILDIDQIEDLTEETITGVEEKTKTKSKIIFPDVGKRQKYKITEEILRVTPHYSNESLKEAVHSARRYIVGTRPLFVIITMIEVEKVRGLVEGIKDMNLYAGRLRQRPTIMIFNIKGYNVAAQDEKEDIAAELLGYHNRSIYDILRGLGVIVINWDPEEESFARALLRQRV
jgi:uncharacterized protein (DUF58 family)